MDEQKKKLLRLLAVISQRLIAAEKTLTDLDAAIGDGDCGASLKKGLQLILDRLPLMNDLGMGGILTQAGMTIMSSVGGVSGALYTTAFLRAGKKSVPKTD